MKLMIRSRTFTLTPAMRDHTERRSRLALGRFVGEVARVSVSMSDINGPRGGVDKRCVVRVLGRTGWEVVVSDVDDDMYAAIDRTIERGARAVARRVGRLQEIPTDRLREHFHGEAKSAANRVKGE